ncbi:MAG: hypothetical protein HOW97_07280, partial [Catenulispora sp.]|nr:hypothetical protein [Catenulispora sp.]
MTRPTNPDRNRSHENHHHNCARHSEHDHRAFAPNRTRRRDSDSRGDFTPRAFGPDRKSDRRGDFRPRDDRAYDRRSSNDLRDFDPDRGPGRRSDRRGDFRPRDDRSSSRRFNRRDDFD